MKKITAAIATATYLLNSGIVHAQTTNATNTIVKFPGFGVDPSTRSIGDVISNGIRIVFIIALLGVLVMLVAGAIQWVFSGGDKEALGKAKNRITHALIGLLILALAFLLAVVVGNIVGINLLNLPALPSLNNAPV